MKNFLAFTLAETLIVMGVIGIVSALTLPNLNSSTGDKERVAKVKKIYQNLNDAFGRAEAVYGPYEEWLLNDSDGASRNKRTGERMTEFMKLSKDCGLTAGCGSSSTNKYKAITADGMALLIVTPNIIVDIDGPTNGSTAPGKDSFQFVIDTEKGIMPNCHDKEFSHVLLDMNAAKNCASSWIINYDNADYLKLNSSGKCPNGTTPTEANPSCK